MDCEGGSDEHLEEDTSVSHNKRVTFSPLIIVLNSEQQKSNLKGTENISAESPYSSDSVSASSSNSSFNDFIPIDPEILQKSRGENNIPQPNGGRKPSHANEKCDTSDAFYRLEESMDDSPDFTSQSSDISHESVTEYMLPTLSPSIQVMEWPQHFVSDGTSASHPRGPSTSKEGSVTSDDSLFCIHSGSKTEDGPKLDMAKDVDEDLKHRGKGMVDERINDVAKAPSNNQADTNVRGFGDSSSAKGQTDKIVTSDLPIALPIKKKSSCLLHHCPDCCPAFHCCNWPIHFSKWSGCSFKWFIQPSCSRNCSRWLGCCCKWPNCQCKCPIWSSCCVKRKL